MRQEILRPTLFSIYLLLALTTAATLSWLALARVDFLYAAIYEMAGLGKNIDHYAPKNRYRHRFEETTKAERVRLFAAIVTAIHHQGEGLESLTYHTPQGEAIAPLLRHAEVIHLKDVAHLIDRLLPVGLTATLLFLAATAWLLMRRPQLPPLRKVAPHALLVVALLLLLLFAIGPTRVFYALHVWIFPVGHKWFFYYQESLMSTMMRAPLLFGYIAALWGGVTLLFTTLFLLPLRRLPRQVVERE